MDADIAELASLIVNELNEENADTRLPEVLKQLDRADNMARGMESRLDELLGHLDQLLNGLEEAQSRRQVQTTTVHVQRETVLVSSQAHSPQTSRESNDSPGDVS